MAKEFQIGSHYGPYVVQEVIAQGGQGVVLRTTHSQLGVQVALKLLLNNSELSRRRFLREIETLRSLKHPRLPRAFDLGEHEGTPFIALELIEGQSLRDLVKVGGPLPEGRAVEIVLDVARTVAYCHAEGVLHRDLKPANVVLRAGTSEPFVVDFGIVKVEGKGVSDQSRLSLTGELVGTPAFMAPEQADGEATVGEPADVYGLGVILYYLLCGQEPFAGENAYNLLTKLALAPTPDVRVANPDVPAGLAGFLLRAMAKDPRDRPQTVLAFAGELDQALRAPPGVEPSARPRWLHPGLLVGIALLAGVGALLASDSEQGPAGTPSLSPLASPNPSGLSGTASPAARNSSWVDAKPGPPGLPRWTFELERGREFLGSIHLLGPFVVAPHGPRNAAKSADRSEVDVVRLVSKDGRHIGAAPPAEHWAWDSIRKRTVFVFSDELFRIQEGSTPHSLAPAPQLRALCLGPRTIYLSQPGSLDVLSSEGKRIAKFSVQGTIECPPLLVDVDGSPGPDRLLVPTTDSQLHLLDLEGRPLDVLELPGPSVFRPTLLRGDGQGSAEVLLTSGAGVLTRVEVSTRGLRLLESVGLGEGVHPVGPARVGRTPTGEPRRIYVATRREILCLSPILERVEWGVGLGAQSVVRGIRLADFDRDGVDEVLGSFETSRRLQVPLSTQAVFDAEGRPRFMSPGLPGRGATCLLGRDSVLVQFGETLQAWGPWQGLTGPLKRAGVTRTRPRPLTPASVAELLDGATAQILLQNEAGLAPFEVRFEGGNAEGIVDAARGEGVFSAYLLTNDLGGPKKQLLGKGSRYELSFMVQEDVEEAHFDVETQVQEDLGPGFVEILVGVDERYLPRTRQLRLGRSVERFRLGKLPRGGVTIKIAISSRSDLRLQLLRARLVLSE
ncbi:MAG: serine/threonine protein kinase [Planctomycetes bacterium]|nr:serine/threonine protein kinase [Planctomycetota bacterium]